MDPEHAEGKELLARAAAEQEKLESARIRAEEEKKQREEDARKSAEEEKRKKEEAREKPAREIKIS